MKITIEKEVVYMKTFIIFVISLFVLFTISACSSVDIAGTGTGTTTAKFCYGEHDIFVDITESDLETIADIFQGKKLYSDHPSCGFSDNVAVMIDGNTFCIARDNCGIVYVKEKNRYFNLSDEENLTVRTILESYGFVFPCV